jgi:hypothetical protein
MAQRSVTVVAILWMLGLTLTSCGEPSPSLAPQTATRAAIATIEGGGKDGGPISTLISNSPTPIFSRPGYYDYGASIIEEGGIRRYYWCANDATTADVILYRWQNLATGQFSPTTVVLRPDNDEPTWDRSFICDPSVVRGVFVNPEDNITYTFAMYYTATDRGPGGSYDPAVSPEGSNARVGVAFSNDGANWVKYSSPVIFPQSFPTNAYGAGQTAVYNADGGSSLYVFYFDSSVGGEKVYLRTTTDGVNFSAPSLLSTNGILPGQTPGIGELDIAYDYVNSYWYATIPYGYADPEGFRAGERARYLFGLYRIPANNLTSGTWEHLGFIDTNLTGHQVNHNSALVRDSWGNINVTLPNVEIVYSAGDNDPTSWELYTATWSAQQSPRIPLQRYYSAFTGTYLVTTGYHSSTFALQQTLGYLLRARTPGTIPLYGCKLGITNYVSTNDTCESQPTAGLGVNGFIYSSPPSAPYVALYRCFTGVSHFVSTSSTCEGQQVNYLLGYALLNPS